MAELDTLLVELYRSQEMLELTRADWHMAVQIFAAMGWTPERPLDAYTFPLTFVQYYEGAAMHKAGGKLFAAIRVEPILSASVQMDLGLLYRIAEFAGGGAFIVGKKGAYAEARSNGDLLDTPGL